MKSVKDGKLLRGSVLMSTRVISKGLQTEVYDDLDFVIFIPGVLKWQSMEESEAWSSTSGGRSTGQGSTFPADTGALGEPALQVNPRPYPRWRAKSPKAVVPKLVPMEPLSSSPGNDVHLFREDEGMLIEYVRESLDKLTLGKRDRDVRSPTPSDSPQATDANRLVLWSGKEMRMPEREKKKSRKEQRLLERWLKLRGYSCAPMASQRALCYDQPGALTEEAQEAVGALFDNSLTIQDGQSHCWVSIDVRMGEGEQQEKLLELNDNGTKSYSLLHLLCPRGADGEVLRRVLTLLQDGGILSMNLNESVEAVQTVKDGDMVKIVQLKIRLGSGVEPDVPPFWKWISRQLILEMLGLQQLTPRPARESIVTRSQSLKGISSKGFRKQLWLSRIRFFPKQV